MQTIASKTIQEYHISEKDYVFINVNRHHKLKDEKMTSIYLCVYIYIYTYIGNIEIKAKLAEKYI